MKVLLGATAAAVMLLAAPALAQTGAPAQCVFTAPPTIPDGATASNNDMRVAREALEAWRTTRQTELTACQAAVQALQAQAQAGATAHNNAAAETDATIQRFAAENTEHTGSSSSGNSRRERGGVITRPDN